MQLQNDASQFSQVIAGKNCTEGKDAFTPIVPQISIRYLKLFPSYQSSNRPSDVRLVFIQTIRKNKISEVRRFKQSALRQMISGHTKVRPIEKFQQNSVVIASVHGSPQSPLMRQVRWGKSRKFSFESSASSCPDKDSTSSELERSQLAWTVYLYCVDNREARYTER